MPEVHFRRILFVLLGAAATALPMVANAQAPRIEAAYSVGFWGINFGYTNYDGKVGDGSYDAKMHFETSGVVSIFWNSKIDANVDGHIAPHNIAPAIYDSYSTDHNSRLQRVKVSFDNGIPSTTAEPPYNTTKYPVTDEQKRGAIDPMSAITSIISGVKADERNPCGTGVQVFDGRRRYDVSFSYLKDEPVKMSNGVFNGTAHLCQIHYNQIAGYKQKIIKEGKDLPPMFVDFADVPAKDAPNGHFVMAIKLWSSLSWGTVTATLDGIKVDGAAPPGMKA